MSALEVRSVSRAEFSTAIDWAAAEGWNPGLNDLEPFHKVDPQGFLMGFVGDEPVSSISVVRYGESFGFLGFYIVRPEFRGKGYGMATWNAGLEHLQGRVVGLDGVVDQQDNYRKSGFVYHGRNVRYAGIPGPGAPPASGVTIRSVQMADMPAVTVLDRQAFPAPRASFLELWLVCPPDHQRHGLIAEKDGKIVGYGAIRRCREGWKVGPLIARDAAVASALFGKLCSLAAPGETVILDVPESHGAAVGLAQSNGLEPVFETARMYLGEAPEIADHLVFGITTFELG